MDEIEIRPYDPSWPAAFDAERERLKPALSGLSISGFHHFGSTAVPGLAAKPVIDILLVTDDLAAASESLPTRLDRLGYDFWADNPKPDRLFFVRGMPPRGSQRTHHLHVCEPGSDMHTRLAFTDYLRAHPDEADAYGALKRDLAGRYRTDREAYTAAKQAFIDRIMRLAGAG